MPDPNTAWRCSVCGYVHHGPEPPEECPVCGAPREDFLPIGRAAAGPAEATKASRVVIVGGGIAGVAAAESLREADPSIEIVLVSQEKEHPYYRLNLTRYLAGLIPKRDLPIHLPAWYAEQHIELLLGTEVSRLRLEDHAVELSDGRRLPFEKLLLAAGASPLVPPIPGRELAGVTCLRTLEEADYILEASQPGVRAVCLGGGILGLETAGALARRGADVTLLESHQWLMPRQLNPAAGEILGEHVRGLGIELVRQAVAREILGDKRVRGVLLEDGSEHPADLVVIATGIRPNRRLAEDAGLEVRRGVVVDHGLRASHPDVFAAGDVAEHEGVVYGLWLIAQAQGAIAGMNLAGRSARFARLPRFNTLKVLGLELCSIGQVMPEDARDQAIDEKTDGRYYCFVFREGRLVGAILLGDPRLVSAAKRAVESRRDYSRLLQDRPAARAILQDLEDADEAAGDGSP